MNIFLQLLFGGFLGLVGQSLRIVVGMKKLGDEAKDKGVKRGDLIETSRLLISLLIGFLAGVIAVISLSEFKRDLFAASDILKQTILTIIAAGYAGADFIDGFITKYIPNNNSASSDDNQKKNQENQNSSSGLSDEQLVKLAIDQNESHFKIIYPNIKFFNDSVAMVNSKRTDVVGIYLKDNNVTDIPKEVSVNYNNKSYTVATKVFPNVDVAKISTGMDGTIADEHSRLDTGSACCTCKNSDGDQFVLTNCHVLTAGDLDDPLNDTGNDKVLYSNEEVGNWSFGIMDESGDFAMILLKNGDQFIDNNNVEQFNNQLKTVTKNDYLSAVTVRGNKSNQTGFIIDKVLKKVSIQYNYGQTITFNEVILLGNTQDGSHCTPVTESGDSGGAIFTDKMELVGMITGTFDGRFTVVLPLTDFAKIHSLQII